MSNKLQVFVDPTLHFNEVSTEQIIEEYGLVPHFVVNPEFEGMPLKQSLADQYGFNLYEFTGGTIHSNGVYSSNDGDPDLWPLMKIIRGNETFYQYHYAVVAIVNADSTFVTRMD